MDCKRARKELTDFAATPGGGLLPAALQAHLTACAECRAAYERERQLFAAIDRGFEQSLAAEPSPNFAARVQARIAEAQTVRRPWILGWAPLTALALVLVLLAVLALLPRDSRLPNVPEVTREIPRPARGGAEPPAGARTSPPLATNETPAAAMNRRSAGVVKFVKAQRADPEVLVEAGQQAAVRQLCAAISSGRMNTARLVAAAQPLDPELLKIQPLEIARLEGTPGEESAPVRP